MEWNYKKSGKQIPITEWTWTEKRERGRRDEKFQFK
jgi:hypothetical protein